MLPLRLFLRPSQCSSLLLLSGMSFSGCRKQLGQTAKLAADANTAIAGAGWGVFLIVFFAISREGFETVIFLMGSFSMTDSFSCAGFFSGLFIAIVIGYAVVVQGKNLTCAHISKPLAFC